MRRTIRSQRGIGIARLLFYLVLIMVGVTIVLKLGPRYIEYFEIRAVMQNLAKDPSLAGKDRYRLTRVLEDRLYMNYLEVVKAKDFKFQKTDKGYRVSLKYEVKEHLFANVDVLLTFSYAVLVGKK
jgi:hypothetical protein